MVHEIKNMPKLVPVTVEQALLEISKKDLLQKGSLNGYKVVTIVILGVATGLAAAAAAVAAVFAAYLITGLCAVAFIIGLTATICASKIKISPKWAKQKNQFIEALKKAKDDCAHNDEIFNQKNEEISRLKREQEEHLVVNAKKIADLETRILDLEKADVDQPTEDDEQQNDEFAKLKNQLTVNPMDENRSTRLSLLDTEVFMDKTAFIDTTDEELELIGKSNEWKLSFLEDISK